MKVIDETKQLLGDNLYFSETTAAYLKLFPLQVNQADYLFYCRLDTDDAFHPKTFMQIHRNFINSAMPFGILSPYYGNLWYPTAGKGCGDIIYNTNLRRYPIMQTSAFHKNSFKRVMNIYTDKELMNFFSKAPGLQMLPYHYEHLKPEDVFIKIMKSTEHNISMPINVQDCILYFNIFDNGVPGIIYTQTGLQSSLVRKGWKRTTVLKWYERYEYKKDDPDVCETLQKFGMKINEINYLRDLIEKNHNRFSMDQLNAGKIHTNETFW